MALTRKHNFKKSERVKRKQDMQHLYLPHDTNRCLSGSLSDTMFHQVKHVFVIQQSNQVEGTKAGSTA